MHDGDTTIGEITERGDFGLGTLDGLDGEMVELDGHVYQIRTDGVAYLVADGAESPFAVVTFFAPDDTLELARPMDCEAVEAFIDDHLPTANIPYAIKIDGAFDRVKARSVPKQAKPFRPLADVIAEQVIFEFTDVEGTIVGFRLPGYMAGANAAGYHLHFITSDRLAGGHVLECQVADVRVEIDYTDEWYVELPSSEDFYDLDLEAADSS